MNLKQYAEWQRQRADHRMLIGIWWAGHPRLSPHLRGFLLAETWIAQLEAEDAEEEWALQAAIDKAGAFA